jgi:hypothetical protein
MSKTVFNPVLLEQLRAKYAKQEISIDALLECAKRELKYRRRVYPRLVLDERMRQESMDHEIACMERIVEMLDQMNGRLF